MNGIAVSFAVLAAVVVLFVWNRFPVELVALGAALTLVGHRGPRPGPDLRRLR
jgi:uncharacterized BrkB/YihY/UPF0761 family membrane protein